MRTINKTAARGSWPRAAEGEAREFVQAEHRRIVHMPSADGIDKMQAGQRLLQCGQGGSGCGPAISAYAARVPGLGGGRCYG